MENMTELQVKILESAYEGSYKMYQSLLMLQNSTLEQVEQMATSLLQRSLSYKEDGFTDTGVRFQGNWMGAKRALEEHRSCVRKSISLMNG